MGSRPGGQWGDGVTAPRQGILCPSCGAPGSRVSDSRSVDWGQAQRRRRDCVGCGQRFTTIEALAPELRRGTRTPNARRKFSVELGKIETAARDLRAAMDAYYGEEVR